MAQHNGSTDQGFGGLDRGSELEELALELFCTTDGMGVIDAVAEARRISGKLTVYAAAWDLNSAGQRYAKLRQAA